MKAIEITRSSIGHLYRATCAICIFYAATAASASSQTFTSLYSFCSQSNCTDGSLPEGGLTQATNGSLYGTTLAGGTAGYGTILKITPAGALTTLYSFCSESACADGAEPAAGVVQGTDGSLYGTTAYGANSYCQENGCGTIFKVTQSGALTTLVSFDFSDGADPVAALIQGSNGSLYGTTYTGGVYGAGTAFGMTDAGVLTTLHSFCEQFPCTGGANPTESLVQGGDGNFYGMTSEGGTGNGCGNFPPVGCGTVFKMTSNGKTTILHSFCKITGCPDGVDPQGALVQASDGNFYGTSLGGGFTGYGTIFKITTTGVLTTLYSFCSQRNCADGAYPYAGLVQGTDGNLYGTTNAGGASGCGSTGCGTLFKITLKGALTTLYTFCTQSSCSDGANPGTALVQDTNGKFYGTTYFGGLTGGVCAPIGCGTIFSLDVGLGAFVEPEPKTGAVGATVNILGTALSGATTVTFNGTPASFTVSSGSLITTTVPAGATTGRIEVITPRGTLRSNIRFRVLP